VSQFGVDEVKKLLIICGRTVLLPVSMGGDEVTSLQGVKRHEEALLEARERGVKVKGMLLCNPHNPLGRCYPKEVVERYLSLCKKYDIHFIR
jgi:aspartate/methionine/tyrosine aminotransferase